MNDERVPWAVRLSAARDLLDRSGVVAKTQVSIEIQPWENVIDRIIVDDPGHPAADPDVAAQIEEWNAEVHDRTRDPDHMDQGTIEGELVEPTDQPADSADTAAPVEVASLSSRPPARLDPDRLAARPPTRPRRRKG